MWSPKLTDEEIEEAWANINWATHYVSQWRLQCLLWFAVGFILGVLLAWIV